MQHFSFKKSLTFFPIDHSVSRGTNLKCECGYRCTILTATDISKKDKEGTILYTAWCCPKCFLVLTEESYAPGLTTDDLLEEFLEGGRQRKGRLPRGMNQTDL
jgi:hypothetical protein